MLDPSTTHVQIPSESPGASIQGSPVSATPAVSVSNGSPAVEGAPASGSSPDVWPGSPSAQQQEMKIMRTVVSQSDISPAVSTTNMKDGVSPPAMTPPHKHRFSLHLHPSWMHMPHFHYRRIMHHYFEHFHIYHPSWLPRGSTFAAGINVMAVTIGVGTLSTPYAAAVCGPVMFVLLVILTFLLTVWSVFVLARLVDVTQMHSFEMMSRKVFNSHHLEVLVEVFIVINCFGSAMAYVVVMADVAESILAPMFTSLSPGTVRFLAQSFFFLACFLPLSLLRTMEALKYASSFGIFAITLLVLFVSGEGLATGTAANLAAAASAVTLKSLFTGLPLLFFAYGSQINCVEIYSELHERTPFGFAKLTAVGMGIITVAFIGVGLGGLSDFGTGVSGNILKSYPTSNPMAVIAMLGVGIKVLLSFPFLILPCREAILHMIGIANVRETSTKTHVSSTVIIAGSAFVVAVFVPTVVTLFGVIGAICAGLFGFILPGSLALMEPKYNIGLSSTHLLVHRVLNVVLIVLGVIVGSLGFVLSLAAL